MLPWVDRKEIKVSLRLGDAQFQVEDTIKLLGGKIGHVGRMTKGMIKTGDEVTLKVDAAGPMQAPPRTTVQLICCRKH